VTQYVLLVLGGCLITGAAFAWLLYKLGRFEPAPRERRSWLFLVAITLIWSVILVMAQPRTLPLPFVLAANAGAIALLVWSWRTGRFAVERLPADVQAEVIRRRRWFRDHRRLFLGLVGAFVAVNLVWTFAALLLLAKR
jgi:hypothetical protein